MWPWQGHGCPMSPWSSLPPSLISLSSLLEWFDDIRWVQWRRDSWYQIASLSLFIYVSSYILAQSHTKARLLTL